MTRVTKDARDWMAVCEEHDEITYCSDWEMALEAAYGHVAMRHPKVCTHELGYIVDDQHRCLRCGIDLPTPRNLDTQQDVGEGDGS